MSAPTSTNLSKIVTIDADCYERWATGSLTAAVFGDDCQQPEEVVLRFPLSSLAQCQKRGGPQINLCPEFFLPCLLQDLLRLQERGIKVRVETFDQ